MLVNCKGGWNSVDSQGNYIISLGLFVWAFCDILTLMLQNWKCLKVAQPSIVDLALLSHISKTKCAGVDAMGK